MLSLGAHKFYGPKGVGALYVRQRTPIHGSRLGGGQEKNRRAGTENVAGVVGMAKALELAYAGARRPQRTRHATCATRLLYGIPERVPHVHVTGPSDLSRRAPNNFSACFEYIEGEAVLIALDLAGICRLQRQRLHQRLAGALPRPHRPGCPGGPRPRQPAPDGGEGQHAGADRARAGVLPGIVSRIRFAHHRLGRSERRV